MSTATRRVDQPVEAGPLEHLGLLYYDTERYLTATIGFVRAALAAGDPVLVAVPRINLDLISEGLGSDATQVSFADISDAGRNPGRILPGILLTFAAQHAGRPVSMIGEPVWPGRRPAEYPACAVHEALTNAVFAGRDAAILCPYDAKNLPAGAVADAHRTHPVMINEFGDRQPSATYGDPVHTAASFNYPLSPPPKHADSVRYQHRFQLRQVRAFVAAHASQAGLSAERIADLTIAVNELATNTLEHTDGPGRLSMWTQDDTLHCQVEDRGQLTDPLAGRVLPAPQALCGRGLVLVNELCDLVRIHTIPGSTTVRLYTYLDDQRR